MVRGVVDDRLGVLIDGPDGSGPVFLFAHGAGAPMDTPFMNSVAQGMAEQGIRVVRFEFPYMARRRKGGNRGAPDRHPVLLDTWRQVIEAFGGGGRVFIGGKSMGGRMATMVADEAAEEGAIQGVICFGYPFHPPGKKEQLRIAHLEHARAPMLIVQGTRDPFGTRDEVAGYPLSPSITVEWIEKGDHSLKGGLPRAVDLACAFIKSR